MATQAEPAALPLADPMQPRFERVSRATREGEDIWTIEIDVPEGFAFLPGQFNMLYAPGVGEAAISISGDPAEAGRLVHTIRSVGMVSAALARLEAGDLVGIRGPYGHGWPVDQAEGKDVLIFAGGLGLAPLRPAIYRLLAGREHFGRVALLIGMRRPEDILFRHQIESWRSRLDVEVEVTVDHAGSDWHGNVGVVTTLVRRAAFDPQNCIAFTCGPEVMMRFVAAELAKTGVPAAAVHVSLERNMKCAIGLCGHCQFLGDFVCKDGPVFPYDHVRRLLAMREI